MVRGPGSRMVSLVNGKPAHMFTGLAAASGKVEVTRDVDPAGVDTAALLQRTGLTLDDGQVVFGMSGNDGDCAAYRGRLIAVPETGGTPKMFTVDAAAGESQGAIWMGGAAPVADSTGNIWVSTGNGSVHPDSHAYDNSDSKLELSPSLKLLQFFAPASWGTNNSEDLDMSTAPVLLSDGQVILTGKSRVVYLLNGAHAFTASARASATKPAPTPSPAPLAGIVVAGLVVIGGMGWLVWRRPDHRNSS